MALNPIVLIRATELLSDTLSAVARGLSLFVSLAEGRPGRRAFLAFAGRRGSPSPSGRRTSRSCPALVILWLLRGAALP